MSQKGPQFNAATTGFCVVSSAPSDFERMIAQLPDLSAQKPVLIAGPTASGKSALALHIAQTFGGTIINADALQVFTGWNILTARPPGKDLAAARHELYGHVPHDAEYSVGHWLRDVAPLLSGDRPIIVGGTGLYFAALTEGLAPIPATPPAIRAEADTLPLATMLAALDAQTQSGIDTLNRARVQRAWEVQKATGRSIADWQTETPPPILPPAQCTPLVLNANTDWLNARIAQRFDLMLEMGVLDEARQMEPFWDPTHASAKAIGAAELIAHIRGETDLDAARQAVITTTRQYAKRQRTWFRKRMRDWTQIALGPA